MDKEMLIRDIFAREILDSRGNPTIERCCPHRTGRIKLRLLE